MEPDPEVRLMELLASCFWCGSLHAAKRPLSLCPACTKRYQARRFPMGPLEMSGSFALEDGTIDDVVRRISPGNYALGYLEDDAFVVFYVGRSDCDVRRTLHDWVGAPSRYERHAPSARAPWGTLRRGALPIGVPALARVGSGVESAYTRFAYSYAASAEAAYEKECRNYDAFGGSGGLDNPARPVLATP